MIKKAITISAIAALGLACGPEAADGDDPPGELEYEHPYARIYRLDRRVDVIFVEEHGQRRECGLLTTRAYDELERTIVALDPRVDYGHDPETQECRPAAWVHIEGFEHSPFECSWQCCTADLLRAALVYSIIEANFSGTTPIVDGEPYVAIEPDQPCE
jgi:hypothetical protein